MKAAVIYQAGGPENFVLEDRPLPLLKEGWSLVKVLGFGVNHSEIFTRQGLSPSVVFPRVLGIECVGEIVETNNPELEVGQTIISIMGEMGREFDGSYAQYVLLPDEQIYPVETDLPLEQLVAMPETYYTAFGGFKNLKITDNDTVLVRGASSGVGLAFLRLLKAKYPKLTVTGTTRNLSKASLLLEAGFDKVIEDKDGVLQTKERFDKVLELIGPATVKDSLAHTREGGIVCSLGQLGGRWYLEDFDPIMELQANTYLTTFYSGNVSRKKIQEMVDYIAKYQVDTRPEKIYGLSEIAEAHRYLDSHKGLGKVIVLVDHES